MKKFSILLLAIVLSISCKKGSYANQENEIVTQNPVEKGAVLFSGKGACIACHKPEKKLIGPSLSEIAKIYKLKNGNMVSFFKGDAQPIVDPSQYDVMKTNLVITTAMTEDELRALEAYVYSFLK